MDFALSLLSRSGGLAVTVLTTISEGEHLASMLVTKPIVDPIAPYQYGESVRENQETYRRLQRESGGIEELLPSARLEINPVLQAVSETCSRSRHAHSSQEKALSDVAFPR